MNSQTEALIQQFAKIHALPIQLYHADERIKSWFYTPFPVNIPLEAMRPYIRGRYPLCYVVSPSMIQSGYLELPESDDYLIIGPCYPIKLTFTQAEQICAELSLSRSWMQEVMSYFVSLPVLNSDSFADTLQFLHMLTHACENTVPVHLTYQAFSLKHFLFSGETMVYHSPAMEDEISLLIRHGKTDELRQYLDTPTSDIGDGVPELGNDAIRSLKNTAINTTAITSRIALECGMSYDTMCVMTDYYINTAENLYTCQDLIQLIRTIMLDFAKRISLIGTPDSDSLTVSQTCKYIQQHIREPLSTSRIAHTLGITSSYLGHHFHEETGVTLTSFIHQEKIRQAEYLLETSDLSLVQIAEDLGYSSQQKFQQWFKRITGTTPCKYRREKNQFGFYRTENISEKNI